MKLFRTIEAVADGNYMVGDKISFNLTDGEQVEALAVKQEQDGMVFVLVDCLKKEYSMNRTASNRGGYKACALRKALNGEIIDRFPAEIREKMVAFENGDLLRLPTEREVFGYNPYGKKGPDGAEQWAPMKDCRNRIAFRGSKTGTWEWHWLQNKVDGSAALFANVGTRGHANYGDASGDFGVRPVFKLNAPQEAFKMSEWISVKDRLPVKELEAYKKKFPSEETIECIVAIYEGEAAEVATVLEFDGERFRDVFGETYNVTHWMAMPNMPGKD